MFLLIWTNFCTFKKIVNNNIENIRTPDKLQLTTFLVKENTINLHAPTLCRSGYIYIYIYIYYFIFLTPIYYDITIMKKITQMIRQPTILPTL